MTDLQQGLDELDQMGPVDYLILEFPGNKMTGEGFPLLVDLVDRGIIRILDFMFVMKDTDGSVQGMAIADLDGDGELDLAVFEGASSGLLDEDDIGHAGGVIEPGSSAAVSSTRTSGPPHSRSPCAAAARRWSPAVASPSRPSSLRLTQSRPRAPKSDSAEEGRAMPGLLRGVARTAVIAGTATTVSNRVSRRQAGRWAEQDQQQQAQRGPAAAAVRRTSAAPAPAGRRHGRQARAAEGARQAEGAGHPDRRGVRAAEGPHPRLLNGAADHALSDSRATTRRRRRTVKNTTVIATVVTNPEMMNDAMG